MQIPSYVQHSEKSYSLEDIKSEDEAEIEELNWFGLSHQVRSTKYYKIIQVHKVGVQRLKYNRGLSSNNFKCPQWLFPNIKTDKLFCFFEPYFLVDEWTTTSLLSL